MKVQELITKLGTYNPEDSVEIITENSSIGQTSTTNIENIFQGFDWDSGKVLIYTSERIFKIRNISK